MGYDGEKQHNRNMKDRHTPPFKMQSCKSTLARTRFYFPYKLILCILVIMEVPNSTQYFSLIRNHPQKDQESIIVRTGIILSRYCCVEQLCLLPRYQMQSIKGIIINLVQKQRFRSYSFEGCQISQNLSFNIICFLLLISAY